MSVRDDLTRVIERAISDVGARANTGAPAAPSPAAPSPTAPPDDSPVALRLHRHDGAPVWTFPARPPGSAPAIAETLRSSPDISHAWVAEGRVAGAFVTVTLAQPFLVRVLDDPVPAPGSLAAPDPRGVYPPGEGPDYARRRLSSELALSATELPTNLPADRSALTTPADTWLLALLVETPDVYAGAEPRRATPRGITRLHRHLEDLADATLDWLVRTPPRPVTWHTPATAAHAARAQLARRILAILSGASEARRG